MSWNSSKSLSYGVLHKVLFRDASYSRDLDVATRLICSMWHVCLCASVPSFGSHMARMLDAQNVWPWLEFAHDTGGYAFVVAKVRRALAHVSAAASPGSNGGCQDN